MVRPLILMFFFLFIQGTVLNHFDIEGILPNVGLVYLLYLCFYLDRYTALSFAALYSFFASATETAPPLVEILPALLLVPALNLLSGFIDARNLTSWLLSSIIGTVFLFLMQYFFLALSLDYSGYGFVWNMLIQLGYNLVVVSLFFPLIVFFEKWGKDLNTPLKTR